jgi:hypothetical protein
MRSNDNDDKGDSHECPDARILRGRVGAAGRIRSRTGRSPQAAPKARLKEKNILLPPKAAPVANFCERGAGGQPAVHGGQHRGAVVGRKGDGGQVIRLPATPV